MCYVCTYDTFVFLCIGFVHYLNICIILVFVIVFDGKSPISRNCTVQKLYAPYYDELIR